MATKKTVNTEVTKRFDKVKETAKEINKFMLETSEEIVDVTVKRGAEWQHVADKAVKGGLKLAANQQDILFNTLEMVKEQVLDTRKRFKTLFSKN